jgi:hypothetical protein
MLSHCGAPHRSARMLGIENVMRKLAYVFSLTVGILLIGCATESGRPSPPPEPKPPSPPTYWDLPTSYQMPKTDGERQEECARVRQEMARVQSIAQVARTTLEPMDALPIQILARNNLARLESRAAEVGCRAAFSDTPPSGQTSFDECFAKCKKLTSRTNEQCFDSCKR